MEMMKERTKPTVKVLWGKMPDVLGRKVETEFVLRACRVNGVLGMIVVELGEWMWKLNVEILENTMTLIVL